MMDCQEPYRATKLWNEVISAFQSGMPLKKHRRKIHLYHDCFLASDAVTWLHCYLLNNPNFGPDVSRQQTVNLLGKFLKCRVLESITNKSKKNEFSDDSHLYRFTSISPQQFKTLPLRLIQSPAQNRSSSNKTEKNAKINKKGVCERQKENIPECLFVEKKMSLTEIGLTWKTITFGKLERLLPDIDLNEILDEKSISGHVIKHNVCRLSKTGVVSLIDKTDDIPHWVISAMKCLANWPNASGSGSCLPNYPGFEKDVFKVVRDFFINPQDPLIPVYLSSAMMTTFKHILHDQLTNIYFKSPLAKDNCSLKQLSKSPSSEVKTSTPLLASDKLPSKHSSLAERSDGKLLLDDPEVMWDYPSMVFFETDFGTSDPITKVVPSHSRTDVSGSAFHGSTNSLSTISMCSVNHETVIFNGDLSKSSSPLKNWSSDSCLQKDKISTFASHSLQLQRNISMGDCNKKSHSMFSHFYVPDSNDRDKLNESVCSSQTITAEEQEKVSLCDFEENCVSPLQNQKLNSDVCYNSSPHQTSYSSETSRIRDCLKQFEEMNFPSELKSAVQLLLLFLNPPNRRQLHLLFRVINKILKNNKFLLDVKMPMRDYLLQTFLPAIVQSDENQNILLGIVSFLLDNCETLFQPPQGLKEEVEEVCRLRNGKIVYTVDDTCLLTYCEMVSKQQYEEQRETVSASALKSLLHSVIMDEKISEKERKRRIKQFKENHPEVYYDLFPGKQNHLVKQKSTFLNRLANLRM